MNIPAPADPVFDVTEDNFETEVLQASLDTPVLLDFWAEWCGPCKSLGPLLDKLAAEYGGAFRLGKVDVESQKQLAGAFGIRSIPTVMLVKDGQPVDGFAGALPENQLREFLGRHLAPVMAGVDAEPADAAAPVETPVPAPASADTVAALRDAIQAQPDQPELHLQLADALIQTGQVEAAARELDGLPAALAEDARAKALRARLDMARELADAPDLATLQQRVQADPTDWAARDQLGVRLFLANHSEAALEEFLYLLEHARDWQDGQARQRLLDAFAIIDDAAVVGPYRRRMTSLLF